MKNLTPASIRNHIRRGFSLIELLIVIMILGAVSAIAVASMSNLADNSRVTAAKSRAQRIASVFGSGSAAGAPSFVGAKTFNAALAAVSEGSFGAGAFATSYFQVSGVSAADEASNPESPSHYLVWSNGMLSYREEGSETGGTGSGPVPGTQYPTVSALLQAWNAAAGEWKQANPGAPEAEFAAFQAKWFGSNSVASPN